MRKLLLLPLLLTCCGGPTPMATLDVKGGELDGETKPVACTAGELLCDGDTVARCAKDGVTRTPVFDCSTNETQPTCGACAAGPACQSARPLCAGTFEGMSPAPWIFSTSGCNEFQCEAAVIPNGNHLQVTLGGGPFEKLELHVYDLPHVYPGSNLGFINQSPFFFTLTDGQGRRCMPYTPELDSTPPSSTGAFSLTWEGVHAGNLVTIDLHGPITCDISRHTWFDVRAHLEVVLQ